MDGRREFQDRTPSYLPPYLWRDDASADRREISVDFITGNHDAFVIEDADHLLMARSNSNADLHRFLSVEDGVVRAQDRKIIFTPNLPNIFNSMRR